MAAIGFGLSKDAFTSLMKEVILCSLLYSFKKEIFLPCSVVLIFF